jgi:hypothetical protein
MANYSAWTKNTSNLTVSVFRAVRRCASPEPFPELASFQSCALTTARHVDSYLRKAWDGQSGARALAFKMALGSATLQVNPAVWRYSPRSAAWGWKIGLPPYFLSACECCNYSPNEGEGKQKDHIGSYQSNYCFRFMTWSIRPNKYGVGYTNA